MRNFRLATAVAAIALFAATALHAQPSAQFPNPGGDIPVWLPVVAQDK